MKAVRIGLIGLGNIGRHHAGYLRAGAVEGAELVAVARARPANPDPFAGLRKFGTGRELIESGEVEAVVIATPHPEHVGLAMAAFARGLHVMVEKPIAAHKADAERLIAAHSPGLVFAAMFQMRVEPRYVAIRRLLREGQLGQFVRMNWIMTDWFRPEAYYASSGWRATWKGEGGGVLLNQALHNLDMLQWLLGMPVRVRGFCRFGRFHTIEVEDEASAQLEFAHGATGAFVVSTGEAPGSNRLEIAGTRGQLVLEHDRLTLVENEQDMFEFSRATTQPFAKPGNSRREIPLENAANAHAILMRNFVEAIRSGAPLIAPGAEGLHSVELANAILYSSLEDAWVNLPLDGAAYERKLQALIAASTVRKTQMQTDAADMASSFRR